MSYKHIPQQPSRRRDAPPIAIQLRRPRRKFEAVSSALCVVGEHTNLAKFVWPGWRLGGAWRRGIDAALVVWCPAGKGETVIAQGRLHHGRLGL
jgi:hypothetical protein